ncbi:MAG: ABC transporter ATP-binding protein [Bdellovibrionales bacterium]|nr:ABC transporter ATP-binding protein [Bdellovibrionales bacterium]
MGIQGHQLIKEFGVPPTRILHHVEVNIKDGEFVSISGKSGSGKSSLLYILSTLDNPTQGEVLVDGANIAKLSSRDLHDFRNRQVGFIFQFHYLLPELTALENVLLGPRNLKRHEELKNRAMTLLEELEISEQANKFPAQMSGGQQQRVAIARALILQPRYLFADEPTGNLDTANAERVMNILTQFNQKMKTTIVLVTHDPDYSRLAHREILLVDGHLADGTHIGGAASP